MKLYVIRHGQSENNLKGVHSGWADISLTEKGSDDAKRISPFLQKIPFDKIYASDLLRARQTAENAIPGCEYETSADIREIHVGSISGKSAADCAKEYGQAYFDNKKIGNYVPYGGEDREMLKVRLNRFLDMVAHSDYQCVAAFAHGFAVRIMLECVLGTAFPFYRLKCDNCTIAVFEYKDNAWMLNSWINPEEIC